MTKEPSRVSHEALFLESIISALADVEAARYYRGMGPDNRLDLPGWDLTGFRRFQFGDLRIETPTRTVVVEAESGGGHTNLVKYWPLLAEGNVKKRFALAHVFRTTSASDYISHTRLWEFLVDRMREDLERRSVRWESDWEARMFQYRPNAPEDLLPVAAFVRAACADRT